MSGIVAKMVMTNVSVVGVVMNWALTSIDSTERQTVPAMMSHIREMELDYIMKLCKSHPHGDTFADLVLILEHLVEQATVLSKRYSSAWISYGYATQVKNLLFDIDHYTRRLKERLVWQALLQK